MSTWEGLNGSTVAGYTEEQIRKAGEAYAAARGYYGPGYLKQNGQIFMINGVPHVEIKYRTAQGNSSEMTPLTGYTPGTPSGAPSGSGGGGGGGAYSGGSAYLEDANNALLAYQRALAELGAQRQRYAQTMGMKFNVNDRGLASDYEIDPHNQFGQMQLGFRGDADYLMAGIDNSISRGIGFRRGLGRQIQTDIQFDVAKRRGEQGAEMSDRFAGFNSGIANAYEAYQAALLAARRRYPPSAGTPSSSSSKDEEGSNTPTPVRSAPWYVQHGQVVGAPRVGFQPEEEGVIGQGRWSAPKGGTKNPYQRGVHIS